MNKEAPSGSENPFDQELSRAHYKEWFPGLSPELIEKLLGYQAELVKFNKAVNLVSPQTLKQADAIHFADAIYASRMIKPMLHHDAPLYDFGSGNGFPGLIIAILNPDVKVVLVDRDERKLEFCKHVASHLKLSNLTVLIKDVEELGTHSVKNAVARGFAALSKAMLLSRKSLALGGRFFHLKGDSWATEMSQVQPQVLSHWNVSLVGQYNLPLGRGEMAILLTEKLSD